MNRPSSHRGDADPAGSGAVTGATTPGLRDRCGRVIRSMRVSVTDRCNLRCTYCLPEEGIPLARRASILSFEDIAFAVGVAADRGVTRVRLTGGEPLMRKELPTLVRMLAAHAAVEDVALTTNGVLLAPAADDLAAAGLKRVNISIDGLGADSYQRMTRRAHVERAWAGLDAAVSAGLGPIRVNVVVVRGQNEDELDTWARRAHADDLTVRFLELMPIGEGARDFDRGYVDLSAARAELVARYGLVAAPHTRGNGPARYWMWPDGRGRLGFITPMSAPYCDTCSRMRLSATGTLRPCLAEDAEIDAADAIRRRDRDGVGAALERAAATKATGHRWRDGHHTRQGMSAIGG